MSTTVLITTAVIEVGLAYIYWLGCMTRFLTYNARGRRGHH